MFNPTRDQARQFFIGAWQKHRQRQPLTPLETIAVDWIEQHPEYHAVFNDPDSLHTDFPVEEGNINPFLHLSMHLAIAEQLSIDQPPGIKAAYDAMVATRPPHDAIHVIMECLGEVVWDAQRLGTPFSNEAYLELVQKRATRRH